MRYNAFDGGPVDEPDDCACSKSGVYQPDCCTPQDDDEEYVLAFYQQEMRNN